MLSFRKNIIIIVLLTTIHLYFYSSTYIEKLDFKLYDLMTMFFTKIGEGSPTYSVVVDIDEKSIRAFGQWPWPRVIDAELIEVIHSMEPIAIGVNILFPERDRTSPVSMQAFYEKYFNVKVDLEQFPLELQDNDKLLAQTIKESKATLPIYIQNKFHTLNHCQDMHYKENVLASNKTGIYGSELLCNHASIQNGVKDFGFINAWSDNDGIFRRIPLFMKYKQEVFPSLALATLLSFDDDLVFNKDEDMILLNFSKQEPRVISAIDIIIGKVLKRDIQGKVVILGASAVGLNTKHKMFNGKHISNSMIHAVLTDNILNNDFIVQPQWYKQINILLSILLAFIVTQFLCKKKHLRIILFLFIVAILSTLSLFIMYMSGVYISIGYLLVPFIPTLIFLTVYHLSLLNKEREEQEKFLIRQSKLASMGEMISLIAHQWRQPLSAINGIVLNMDIDYRKKKLDEKRLDTYLNEIESTTGYLSNTINDFTEFFSTNKQSQVFNLSNIIDRAKQLSNISSHKNIELIYQKDETIYIKGHGSELIQSLLVLINNSIYQVNLKTIEEGKIFIYVSSVDNNILISVEDNGGGIKKKEMKKIFDPYFTTKETHHGTGLGLYILKLIVEDSMNGKVSVSNGKEGAIFTIEIPKNMK